MFEMISVDWKILICRPKTGDKLLNLVNFNNCEWTTFSLTIRWASYCVSQGPRLQAMDFI